MSKKCLEFLQNSFLYDTTSWKERYKGYTDKQLEEELQKYRDYVLAHLDEIKGEIHTASSKLNICIESCNHFPTEELYKQLVLYMDQVILPDPLFSETHTRSPFTKTAGKMLGLPASDSINRKAICESISYIGQIATLITNNFVVMLPISIMHEGSKEVPITYSPTAFSDVIPNSILKYYQSIVAVRNLVPTTTGLRVITDKPLEMGNRILVDFIDGDRQGGLLYQYMHTKVIDYDTKTGAASMEFRLADEMTSEEFSAWVNQSINQAANHQFITLYKEVVFAQESGCMYLSQSNIVSNVLKLAIDQPSKAAEIATLALSFDLPVTSQIPLTDLLSIRNKYGDAFHNFRAALNSKLLSLDTCGDEAELQKQLSAISYEMSTLHTHEVEKEYRKIARTLKLDAAAFTGSLIANYTAGGLTAIGAAATFVKGITDIAKYYTNVHENNGFFIWKLNKRAEKYRA